MQSYCRLISKPASSFKHFISRLRPRHLHLGEHFIRGSSKEIELTSAVRLAGRKYLSGSHVAGFPEFLSGPRREDFPLLVKAQNGQEATLKHWAKRSREVIEEAYRKYEHDGTAVAILFRGLPVRNAKDFSVWSTNLGYKSFRYVGGTGPRNEIEENVADGAHDDKVFSIEPHNEMAYNVGYPKIFTISSFKTAPWGGETAICDVRNLLGKLDPSFVEKCERKGVRYWHYVRDENDGGKLLFKSWQQQFFNKDSSKVEAYLRQKGYSVEWEGSSLVYWHNLQPFISHARSGERLWFTQVTASHCSYHASTPFFEGVMLPNKKYPFHTTYGDGEEFEQDAIDEYRRVNWESAVGFQWQDGDVLFLDQLVVQHSRLGFEGEREVGVSLLNY